MSCRKSAGTKTKKKKCVTSVMKYYAMNKTQLKKKLKTARGEEKKIIESILSKR